MKTYELALYKDEITSGASLRVAADASVSVSYVVAGNVRLDAPTLTASFAPNSALHSTQRAEITASGAPAVLLRWELTARASSLPQAPAGVWTSRILNAQMALDPDETYLLRCDRVDFPAGGVALLHRHQGGGIRCLLKGSIQIETVGTRHPYGPLEAWFEAGPDPVFAAASKTEASAFVRVMILPRRLLGKSSISYVNAEDLAKPKSQSYQIFIDSAIELPGS